MKTNVFTRFGVVFFILATAFISSCRDRTYEEITYKAMVPIMMGFEEFRSSVKSTPPQIIQQTGKIYFKDNFIFVNEYQKGIHVINNANPASPQVVAFIQIPGNIDMAIKGNVLYADSYIDLVALDITDPANPDEIDRVEGAFPNVLPPVINYTFPIYGLDLTKGVVVGWETKEITEVVENENYHGGGMVQFENTAGGDMGPATIGGDKVYMNPSTVGIAGSMARFTLTNNYLYALHNNTLKLFNVSATPGITKGPEVFLERQVETLFPYENKLFMGTTTGMLVYDISSPAAPTFVSSFNHINSCDPVVIEGDYAYVTLRAGTMCNGFTNQLDVVDISSITNPFLVKSYPMFNPHGLGIDNKILFICDGDAGLKVYDASDPLKIHMNQIAHFTDIKTYDVIPVNGLLMMIGADGLYQYDYSDLDSMKLLSHIPVYAIDSIQP